MQQKESPSINILHCNFLKLELNVSLSSRKFKWIRCRWIPFDKNGCFISWCIFLQVTGWVLQVMNFSMIQSFICGKKFHSSFDAFKVTTLNCQCLWRSPESLVHITSSEAFEHLAIFGHPESPYFIFIYAFHSPNLHLYKHWFSNGLVRFQTLYDKARTCWRKFAWSWRKFSEDSGKETSGISTTTEWILGVEKGIEDCLKYE